MTNIITFNNSIKSSNLLTNNKEFNNCFKAKINAASKAQIGNTKLKKNL